MATYKFNALPGGDWTIQQGISSVIAGASTSQAVASVVGGKVFVRTFFPYYEALIDIGTNIIEIDNVNVTVNGAAAIVSQLNASVFGETKAPLASPTFTGTVTAPVLKLSAIPTYATDLAAGTGGVVQGSVYKTAGGELRIKL